MNPRQKHFTNSINNLFIFSKMNNRSINTVYILGLGALGSMYASLLHDTDSRKLRIIASRERQAALKTKKIRVNGSAYSFEFADPEEAPRTSADLIIIAVKAHQLEQGIKEMQPFVGRDTVVLSLLNGISSEEIIGRHIGSSHMLFAYAIGMDAVREQGDTNYKNMGKIVFGEKTNDVLSERVTAVKALFECARIPHEIPLDMYKALWFKFMMNTGINQASAVLRATYGAFQKNSTARGLMLMAAEEVLLLSQKAGIDLDQSDIAKINGIVEGLNPAGKTSMLQDIEAGRKTEVDIFAGKVIALGKEYDVPTPVNTTLAQIILSIENGI